MKRLTLLIGMAAALAATPALAADLSKPVYKAAPMAAPPFNWGGFYAGVHIGGAWGTADVDTLNGAGALTSSISTDRSGVFGGGQIGYNFMLSPSVLLGIEADVSGSGVEGSHDTCTATGCAHSHSTDDVFGTVRGRLGWVSSNWLFFGSGGFAWIDDKVDRTITCTGGGCPAVSANVGSLDGQVASSSSTVGGWTAGGGVEWGFAPRWTAKVEYLHMGFAYGHDFAYSGPSAAAAFRHSNYNLDVDTVRAGLNYLFN